MKVEAGSGAAERALLARAVDGHLQALQMLGEIDTDGTLAARHRLGPLLARFAQHHRVSAPGVEAWRMARFRAAAYWLRIEHQLGELGKVFDQAGIAWLPLKGIDLAPRVYAAPEDRPTTDMDLLVSVAQVEDAVEALRSCGWRERCETPSYIDYVRSEGHNWGMKYPGSILLELHFRLWGWMPEASAGDVLDAAVPNPELGPMARRATLNHAFVIAAVHSWTASPPRPLYLHLDLARIAAHGIGFDPEEVACTARRWDAALPVALASLIADRRWPGTGCKNVAEMLAGELRAPERIVWRRYRNMNEAQPTMASMVLARLAAGRRSRHGWLSVLRRVWPHAAQIEAATPAGSPMWFRRLQWTLRSGSRGRA